MALPSPTLLCGQRGVGARCVDEAEQREIELGGEPYGPLCLSEALGGHSAVVVRTVVTAPVVSEHDHGLSSEVAEAADHGRVVAVGTIAVQLDEAGEYPRYVVDCRGALVVARQLDRAPRLVPLDLELLGAPLVSRREAVLGSQQIEIGGQEVPEVGPLHDRVDHAVLDVGLRGVRVAGQGRAAAQLDGAHWREAYYRGGLSQDYVGQVREAGVGLARRRVREHRDERQALLVEKLCGDGGLGHLHQREGTLLHPDPSAGDDSNGRQLPLCRLLQSQGYLLSHDAAHGTAHEAEVEHDEHRRASTD